MQNRNIQFQSFVSTNRWAIVGNRGNPLLTYGYKIREKCKHVIAQQLHDAQHIAILHALVLGDKSGLDLELKQTFTDTGTMHVLAVSGLHVGIVYLLTSHLLNFLFLRKLKLLRTILGLLIVWSFALVSGLSPSVCRACFMFSVLSIGLELNRVSSTYNSLCFAGFVLLSINPLNLFDVGFQFSFLAVLGIVVLQKPIRNVVTTENYVLGKLADLLAVSLSAQLATLPLGLFYFGQFPWLFLVSNLLVIPVVTILVYASISLFICHKLPIVVDIITKTLEIYLWFVLRVTELIQSIPLALINNVSITSIELCLLFGIIWSLGAYMLKKSIQALVVMGLLCLGLIGNQGIRRYQNVTSTEVIRFDIKNAKCVILRNGQTSYLLSNENMTSKKWAFHCKPYLSFKGVSDLAMPRSDNQSMVNAFSIRQDTFHVSNDSRWANERSPRSAERSTLFQSVYLPR